jgi:DNA-directed RNA polymerase specialized sigma24 family protein
LSRIGRANRVSIDPVHLPGPDAAFDLLALDEALTRLAETDSEAATLVNLRYSAGMAIPEAAEALSMSPRSVDHLSELRRKVEALSATHDRAGAFLERPPSGGRSGRGFRRPGVRPPRTLPARIPMP